MQIFLKKHKIFLRVIACLTVSFFLLHDLSFAASVKRSHKSTAALMPSSSFANLSGNKDAGAADNFKELASLAYSVRYLSEVIALHHGEMSADSLKDILAMHVPDEHFRHVDLAELKKDGRTFTLPVRKTAGGETHLLVLELKEEDRVGVSLKTAYGEMIALGDVEAAKKEVEAGPERKTDLSQKTVLDQESLAEEFDKAAYPKKRKETREAVTFQTLFLKALNVLPVPLVILAAHFLQYVLKAEESVLPVILASGFSGMITGPADEKGDVSSGMPDEKGTGKEERQTRKRARPRRKSDGKESKWDIFERFIDRLNEVDPEILKESYLNNDVKQKRNILIEGGVKEARDVDTAYLLNGISRVFKSREIKIEEQRDILTDPLSYGGVGRYLICYKDSNPARGLVAKLPVSYDSLRFMNLYSLNGAEIAIKRLGGGLAADSFVIDSRYGEKPLVFYTEEGRRIVAEVAIVQEQLLPLVDHLKHLGRQGCSEEDIEQAYGYIDKFRELIISMYKRGVVDRDIYNIPGNYGIRLSDDSIALLDLGELTDSTSEAASFIENLQGYNDLIAESLEEIDGVILDPRISLYYQDNKLKKEHFFDQGRDLFGSEYDPDSSKIKFPYTSEEIRQYFRGDSLSIKPVPDLTRGAVMAKFLPVIAFTAFLSSVIYGLLIYSGLTGPDLLRRSFFTVIFSGLIILTWRRRLFRMREKRSSLAEVEDEKLLAWNAPFLRREAVLTGEVAEMLARRAGLPKRYQEFLRKAGIAHDIGKNRLRWYFDSSWKAPSWIRIFFSLLHPEISLLVLRFRGVKLMPWEKEVLRHHSYLLNGLQSSVSEISERCNSILVIADQVVARYLPRKYKASVLKEYDRNLVIGWVESFFDPKKGVSGKGKGVLPHRNIDLISVIRDVEVSREFKELIHSALEAPDKSREKMLFQVLGENFDRDIADEMRFLNVQIELIDYKEPVKTFHRVNDELLADWEKGLASVTVVRDLKTQEVIAYLVLRRGDKIYTLEAMAVQPGYRVFNLGKSLFMRALLEAKREGAEYLRVRTNDKTGAFIKKMNASSRDLLKKIAIRGEKCSAYSGPVKKGDFFYVLSRAGEEELLKIQKGISAVALSIVRMLAGEWSLPEKTGIRDTRKSYAKVKELADGSPFKVFEVLKNGEGPMFPDEVRIRTEGRMPDGHLSMGTVLRDLNTIAALQLAEKFGMGEDSVYIAKDFDDDEWMVIGKILKGLGTRPSSEDKKRAHKKLSALYDLGDGLDKRPSEAGLLHPAYVADNMAIKRIVNPESSEKRVLYGGSGMDISNLLLSTNATEAYFVSYNEDLILFSPPDVFDLKLAVAEEASRNFSEAEVTAYKKKFFTGFSSAWNILTSKERRLALAIELEALGITDVRVDRNEGYPRISFMWAYHGEEPRLREITFVETDMTDTDNYPRMLHDFLNEGIDLYYQRASLRMPKEYCQKKCFLRYLHDHLNRDGFFITDDYSFFEKGHEGEDKFFDRSKDFPIRMEKLPVPGRDVRARVIKRVRRRASSLSYGWNLTVRRKKAELAGPAPMRPESAGGKEEVDRIKKDTVLGIVKIVRDILKRESANVPAIQDYACQIHSLILGNILSCLGIDSKIAVIGDHYVTVISDNGWRVDAFPEGSDHDDLIYSQAVIAGAEDWEWDYYGEAEIISRSDPLYEALRDMFGEVIEKILSERHDELLGAIERFLDGGPGSSGDEDQKLKDLLKTEEISSPRLQVLRYDPEKVIREKAEETYLRLKYQGRDWDMKSPSSSVEWLGYLLTREHYAVYREVRRKFSAQWVFEKHIGRVNDFNKKLLKDEIEPDTEEERQMMSYSLLFLMQEDPSRMQEIGEFIRSKTEEKFLNLPEKPEISLKEEEGDEIPESRGERDAYQEVVQEFIDSMILWVEKKAAENGGERRSFMIGVDISWMPEEQYSLSGMQDLLRRIETLSQKGERGLAITTILRRDPEVLAGELWRAGSKDEKQGYVPISNMIIIGEQNVLEKEVFSKFKDPNEDRGAVFAKVKLPDDMGAETEIDILKLISEVLGRLRQFKELREFYLELPVAAKFPIHYLAEIYKARTEILIRA